MQGIKAIKALVAFMGVLLVAGLAVLGWGLSNTAGKAGKPRPAATVAAGTDFGNVDVLVPAGSRIEQALVVGDRLVLRLSGGAERLLVIDPLAGTVAGSFVLTPEAPAGR